MKKLVAHAVHRYHRLPSGEAAIPRMQRRPHHGHAAGWLVSEEAGIRSFKVFPYGAWPSENVTARYFVDFLSPRDLLIAPRTA
jgi:hypothetical protein